MAVKQKTRVRHPWDEWFKKAKTRKGLTLIKGKDFEGMSHSMSVQIRRAAIERKLQASVLILDENTLQVNV